MTAPLGNEHGLTSDAHQNETTRMAGHLGWRQVWHLYVCGLGLDPKRYDLERVQAFQAIDQLCGLTS